ncbi:urease accessory protein UreF [Frigidibacter albus]|uniref:Urease accessory protein UreF n=1 Tax=Frigidibacter albus TaxID=1465486 RepID=A0A6L8VFL9_9RHOB|nr:urease accessory UreF family protein [Frigidibacter albus]MZQ88372.1 urease accessory protein UreF [Frigidibacter albus]NBE29954.1 urease accessory protein UreF [Frigidibacter albus]GGH45780.1 urease accessory protein UreF [Frigidibacter albus]
MAEAALAPDSALMTLVQWLSPAFPVGGYAYSHGLEWAISAGLVADAAGLQGWLADVIAHGSGRSDAVLLALALAPGADHAALAAYAGALAPAKERLTETLEQGRAFTLATNALLCADHPPAPLPVAVGRAAAGLGLPVERVLALYLHSFASSLVQGAVRFVPLGQTEGQQVLAALHPVISRIANWAATAGLDDLGSAGFGSDMAAMAHEGMEVRIFRT